MVVQEGGVAEGEVKSGGTKALGVGEVGVYSWGVEKFVPAICCQVKERLRKAYLLMTEVAEGVC
jgi:hypothetical protein